MQTFRTLFVATAIALCAGSVLRAQEPQTSELPSSSVAGWTLVPGIIVGATYDSNIVVTTSVDETGRPPSDTLFTIDPAGSLRYVGRRTSFGANYRGNIRRYTTVDGLDGYDQHAGASFERRATKFLTIYAQNQFSTAPTTDEIDLVGVPFRRAGSQYDNFGAGFTYRLSEHTDWTGRYDFTWGAFDRQAPDLTGGTINAMQSGLIQHLTDRLKVGGEGSYRFANMDVGAGRRLQFVDVGGTIAYALGQFTTVSAAGGMSHLDDQLRNISRSGPYVRASISHTGEREVVGVSYERSFVPSFGFGGTTRNQQIIGWINLPPIGRRLYLQGSTSLRRSNPLEITDIRRLDTITLRATAGYTVSRQIRVQGVYLFTHQDSISSPLPLNRNRLGIELVLFNPVRIP